MAAVGRCDTPLLRDLPILDLTRLDLTRLQLAGQRERPALPRDRDIILYCTCPSEASAARVAKILMNHGFKHVRPLHGGLDAWVAAGHVVVTA